VAERGSEPQNGKISEEVILQIIPWTPLTKGFFQILWEHSKPSERL